MKRGNVKGFTLAEFVVAIVFVGVVLGPLLLFVARVHDMNSAVGQQARREAWHSFTDQAVTAGIDPTAAPALAHSLNLAIPAVAAQSVTGVQGNATPGLARITPLTVVLDQTTAEPRVAAGGFQIGAGAVVGPRTKPTAPLLPIVMPMPLITPADGSVVALGDLSPSGNGTPYALSLQAASIAGAAVRARLNQPAGTFAGTTVAQFSVSAFDLLQGVNGVAWTEYLGDPTAGDRAIQLGDGRTRWLVTTSENRLQIYEPSPVSPFAYKIALGAPVLVRDGVENVSGATLRFDYAAYYAVQSGTASARLDFPQAVKAAFGSRWGEASIGFQWTFQEAAGPFSGALDSFFSSDALALWQDSVAISATAVVPAGAVTDVGSWTLVRDKSTLATPVLATTADGAGFFTAGAVQFSAPAGPDGSPLGRLSFADGNSLSTGTTLAVTVLP